MQWKRFAVLFLFPILAFSGAFAQKAEVGMVFAAGLCSVFDEIALNLGWRDGVKERLPTRILSRLASFKG